MMLEDVGCIAVVLTVMLSGGMIRLSACHVVPPSVDRYSLLDEASRVPVRWSRYRSCIGMREDDFLVIEASVHVFPASALRNILFSEVTAHTMPFADRRSLRSPSLPRERTSQLLPVLILR